MPLIIVDGKPMVEFSEYEIPVLRRIGDNWTEVQVGSIKLKIKSEFLCSSTDINNNLIIRHGVAPTQDFMNCYNAVFNKNHK